MEKTGQKREPRDTELDEAGAAGAGEQYEGAVGAGLSVVTNENLVGGITSLLVSNVQREREDEEQGTSLMGGAVGGDRNDLPTSAGESQDYLSRESWRDGTILIPQSQLLPGSVLPLADGAEDLLRASFIKLMTKYEGTAVAPSEEFAVTWATMEYELKKFMRDGLIPQDSVASTGLDENSYKDFKQCAEELQNNLFEGNLLESLSNLRGFRRLFSRSSDRVLCHAFRGNPLEVLQNIYFGGDGILPEDRMILDDPFHCMQKDESDDFFFDD
ncbi:uncharacterized protein LOC110977309 isoform X1 [Acanthaster planci]|uniref:Uncharacterized protein LOC110977309 isoform X1 n=1 Tax=Acanthaster planci TaxID=133434 RepID=A0A8B7Y387_ACAPL|nr:uncharacterized protein LOC110977309 isoform X1 [Acanthaster planci]